MTEALDRLINVINDLKANVDPAVTITTDDIKVVNLAFSVTPHLGFPLQQQMSRDTRPNGPAHVQRVLTPLCGGDT